jgi:hypothetical protein
MPSWCLAQPVKVGFAAGAGIDDGGEVARIVEGIAVIVQAKTEGKFQSHFGFAGELSVVPFFPVEDHPSLFPDAIDKRFAVRGKPDGKSYDAREQKIALFIADRNLVDAHLVANGFKAK